MTRKTVARLALAFTLTVALGLAVDTTRDAEPADAHHTCALDYLYGSPTRTIARDTGKPYCDVQARLSRTKAGSSWERVNYYSDWKLYEARVSSWEGTTWTGGARNCGRIRIRYEGTNSVKWRGPFACKY